MRSIMTSIGAMCLAACLVCSGEAAAGGAEGRRYEAVLHWKLGGSPGPEYVLEPLYYHPLGLVGAAVDEGGCVYLCDKLSEKMVKLLPGGVVDFAVGSVGEGPEDHQGYGEVVFWTGGTLARADCSLSPKLIFYDAQGQFTRSSPLAVAGELTRMFWNGSCGVAVVGRSAFEPPDVMVMSSHLVRIDAAGNVVNEVPLRRESFSRGADSVPEEKFWTVPRIAVAEDGYVFVQADLYSSRIECYSRDLEPAWTIEGGWRPERLEDAEYEALVAAGNGRMVPSRYRQTIRRMIARPGGEVWVQTTTPPGDGGATLRFEAFGRQGDRLSDVRLTGLPPVAGEIMIHGNKLLWIRNDGVGEADLQYPTLAVFDLRP